MKTNITVMVTNLNDFPAADWVMSQSQYETLLKHNNMKAKVICTVCQINNNFPDNYYDVEFEDGYIINAIHGLHLTVIK